MTKHVKLSNHPVTIFAYSLTLAFLVLSICEHAHCFPFFIYPFSSTVFASKAVARVHRGLQAVDSISTTTTTTMPSVVSSRIPVQFPLMVLPMRLSLKTIMASNNSSNGNYSGTAFLVKKCGLGPDAIIAQVARDRNITTQAVLDLLHDSPDLRAMYIQLAHAYFQCWKDVRQKNLSLSQHAGGGRSGRRAAAMAAPDALLKGFGRTLFIG